MVSRTCGSFFRRHHAAALQKQRQGFCLLEERFTHSLRGRRIIARDETAEVA
jgi:hypothetical protein